MKARKCDTKQKGLRGSSTGRKRGGYRKLWIRFFLLSRGPHSIRWPTLLCLFLQHLPFHPFLPWASKYRLYCQKDRQLCLPIRLSFPGLSHPLSFRAKALGVAVTKGLPSSSTAFRFSTASIWLLPSPYASSRQGPNWPACC